MRTLFVSNFYPPFGRGGYEEWCQEIALRFLDNGNPVRVLSSKIEADKSDDPPYVFRELNLEMEMASLANGIKFFTHQNIRLRHSLKALEAHVQAFEPDTILFWGMWNFPFEIPALAERLMPGRVAYYLGDYWPTLPPQFKNYWEAEPQGKLTAIPKKLLSIPAKFILSRQNRPKLQLEHGLFCSQYLNDALEAKGIQFTQEKLIYGAIDTSEYAPASDKKATETFQLLTIGRLIEDKGIQTILEAMKILVHDLNQSNLCLNIIGSGEPGYEQSLKNYVEVEGLGKWVKFEGSVPKAQIPAVYRDADLFIFASEWPEPFGRVIVEAMASQVAIVATSVGGAAEIIKNESNALTFAKGNARDLATKICSLLSDSDLRQKLVMQGAEDAKKFDVSRMAAEIEKALQGIIEGEKI